MMRTIWIKFAGALVLLTPLAAAAHWEINNSLSQVSFVTVKATHVAEVHTFKQLSGSVSDDGQVQLSLDLASVDTLIPIRDERMREFLFNTAEHPTATIRAELQLQTFDEAEIGTSTVLDVSAVLELKGAKLPLQAKLLVTKVGKRRLQAHTVQPVIVNAGSVGLVQGVEKLRELAGLPSISHAVPVTVSLTFDG